VSEEKDTNYNFIYYIDNERSKQKTPDGVLLTGVMLSILSLALIFVMVAVALFEPRSYVHQDLGTITGIAAYCYLHPAFFLFFLFFSMTLLSGFILLLTVYLRNSRKSRR